MKYIVLNYMYLYLFPVSDSHNKFLRCLNSDLKCTSAGFVHKGICCGESTSLELKSSIDDTKLFNDLMNMRILGL